jgi:hypothetical protein
MKFEKRIAWQKAVDSSLTIHELKRTFSNEEALQLAYNQTQEVIKITM